MTNNDTLLKNKDFPNNSSSGRVIPFPNRRRHSTFFANRSTGITEPGNNYNTKESIESLVYEILINEKILANEIEINPFGAIYLCDLQPDNIDHLYIEKIRYFSNINDISDSIFFNDGMDD
jgi:hypothetical protein